jgi:hypothetical protein
MGRWLTRLGRPLGLAVLGGATLMTWPLVWPVHPDARLQTVGGRQIGEAAGYVVALDPEAGILTISSSILSLRPLAIAIDADTPILIRDKHGGVGDLAVDMPVRVAYEIQGQTRRARSVELVVPESDSHVRVRLDDVELAPRVEPVRPALPAAAVDVVPKGPSLAPAPASGAPLSTPVRTIVGRRQAAAVISARPPIEDSELADGTAAVEWLFRSRGR